MKREKKAKSSIVRDALSTFGTNAFGSVMALLSSILVLNVLDPSIKGLITNTQLVGSTLYTLLGFSINSAIVYYVSRYRIERVRKSLTKISVWRCV